MRMMLKGVLGLLGAVLAGGGLLGAPAFAMGGGHGGHGGHGKMMSDPAHFESMVKEKVDFLLRVTDATMEQRQKAYAVRDRFLPEVMDLMKQKHELQKEAKELWSADRPDAARLHAMVDRKAELSRTMKHKMVDARIEMMSILTPEQRGKLMDFKEKHQMGDG